ncbi:MAG: Holliday junction resolvase RuvX [Spirulinaceae cyanobacterium]
MARTKLSVLGLDVGRRRIGVAGCDGLGLLATELTTIERSAFAQDVQRFQALVRERQVQRLVVGLPYCMDGSLGFQAQKVQNYAERLAQALELPLDYMDERLTSVEAEQQLKAQRVSVMRNKGRVDRKAAALILQRWLDRRRQTRWSEKKRGDKVNQ